MSTTPTSTTLRVRIAEAQPHDKIRIAIAEAIGWRRIIYYRHKLRGISPNHPGELTSPLPNWPEDLNACAQFEAGLTKEQQHSYQNELVSITLERTPPGQRGVGIFSYVSAPPLIRCLAYLATIKPEGKK
jgi:hypothetical protein